MLWPGMAAARGANVLTEVLTEDAVFRMCHFLPGSALLAVGASCRALGAATQRNASLWLALCRTLLGDTLVHLNARAWASAAPGAPWGSDVACFLQALFRAAYDCRFFQYVPALRQACVRGDTPAAAAAWPIPELSAIAGFDGPAGAGAPDGRPLDPQDLASSGHSVCAVGPFVVFTGGWRPWDGEPTLHTCIVDVRVPAVVSPRLAPGSAKPCRRLRHSSCAVRPAGSHGLPQVLVLGGCDDTTNAPCGGIQTLVFLELVGRGCEEVRWREETAQGQAPQGLWHHACGSFADGKRVVVFGGDMGQDDPEFAHIADRAAARHVYLLDVDRRLWERVATGGAVPVWRSLHAGVTHVSLTDASERFVVMGGCVEHVRLHGYGQPADMRGYSLNLSTLSWQCGAPPREGEDGEEDSGAEREALPLAPGERPARVRSFLPHPRARFAAERVGRHLVIYGGQPLRMADQLEEHLLALNLVSLEWSRIYHRGQEASWPTAPSAVMAGGVISGGVGRHIEGGTLVYLPVPKLEFLCLCPPGEDEGGDDEGP